MPKQRTRAAIAAQPRSPTGRTPAIVLVEDEPDILIILHRLMRDLTGSYDIVTVSSGAEALETIGLRPVPLLITDYNMPGMNGINLARDVKALSPDTVVLLISAYATPELEHRAQDAGVDHYLPKPFVLDRLEQIVRATLGSAHHDAGGERAGDTTRGTMSEDNLTLIAENEQLRIALAEALAIIKSECETPKWRTGEIGQVYAKGRRLLDKQR
jgi:two-component system, response regulator, stage 0 sporulation protein F